MHGCTVICKPGVHAAAIAEYNTVTLSLCVCIERVCLCKTIEACSTLSVKKESKKEKKKGGKWEIGRYLYFRR